MTVYFAERNQWQEAQEKWRCSCRDLDVFDDSDDDVLSQVSESQYQFEDELELQTLVGEKLYREFCSKGVKCLADVEELVDVDFERMLSVITEPNQQEELKHKLQSHFKAKPVATKVDAVV